MCMCVVREGGRGEGGTEEECGWQKLNKCGE